MDDQDLHTRDERWNKLDLIERRFVEIATKYKQGEYYDPFVSSPEFFFHDIESLYTMIQEFKRG